MPNQVSEAEQTKKALMSEENAENEQPRPMAKKSTARKKTTAPKATSKANTEQNGDGMAMPDAPKAEEPREEVKAAEVSVEAPAEAPKPAPRKRSTGTRKTLAQKVSEPQTEAAQSEDTKTQALLLTTFNSLARDIRQQSLKRRQQSSIPPFPLLSKALIPKRKK